MYAGLLAIALRTAASGLLVVRDTIPLAASGMAVLERLAPFMIRSTFLHANDTPCLISIAHESEGFIIATGEEVESIRREPPGLGPLIPDQL